MISIVGAAELIKIMEVIAPFKMQALVSHFQRFKSRAVIAIKPNLKILSIGTERLSNFSKTRGRRALAHQVGQLRDERFCQAQSIV